LTRRAAIAPLVADLETWMRAERGKLSRHAEGAAMDYLLKRWPAFTRFLDDGRICISNNAAERALRGIAVKRSLGPPFVQASETLRSEVRPDRDGPPDRAMAAVTLAQRCRRGASIPSVTLVRRCRPRVTLGRP
jgi:Transposase IS66 family